MGIDQARGIYAVTVPPLTVPGNYKIVQASVRLCGWSLGDAGFPAVPESLDTAVAAAAAGTLTLTGFLTVNEVVVTPAAAWPAGANQVTLTNVTGGTQTAEIEGGTANPVVMSFPAPLATTGTPVVSVPAIVGGPAYTIEAEGTISGGAPAAGSAAAQLMNGGQVLGVSSPLPGATDTQWLTDQGIDAGSGVTVQLVAGAVSGCVYVVDVVPGAVPAS